LIEVEAHPTGPMTAAPPQAFEARTCGLCDGERRPDVAWVCCRRCDTAYHAECWKTATGCVASGCGEVLSRPL
jgi:hypothetical protein